MISPNISIICLIGGMMTIMPPVGLYAQEPDREQVLIRDIERLGERAVRDNVISDDERKELLGFVRDSLPESVNLRIRALEQIRNELDEQYAEMVRNSMKQFDGLGYMGRQMLPGRLYAPEDFVSPEEKRWASEVAAAANAAVDKDKLMKHVKPLNMPPWLMGVLRMLFGAGVSQRPERGDYTLVPQMGGLYNIMMPGGKPDDSWMDAPPMEYDPHPDKHFRR